MSKSAAHVISGHTVVITGAASGIGRLWRNDFQPMAARSRLPTSMNEV
jgi:short-subunit dehydrogenase involved in D-alanine esterification of teichoic acids